MPSIIQTLIHSMDVIYANDDRLKKSSTPLTVRLYTSTTPSGTYFWLYEWNAAGHLSRVFCPDGQSGEFAYVVPGRRVAKSIAGRTTRWVWDGNLPLHEWQEETGPLHHIEPAPAYEMEA